MKILIALTNPLPLVIHETLTLGFALASFGHEVQFALEDEVASQLLADIETTLTKMLTSLELYDIPPAWVTTAIYQKFAPSLSVSLRSQILPKPADCVGSTVFDTTISF